MLLLLLVLQLKLIDVPYGWSGVFHIDALLPVSAISIGVLPIVVRQTRSAMLEVKGQQYVTTARAKGVPEQWIIMRHMLRPVLTPVVTTLGLVMIGPHQRLALRGIYPEHSRLRPADHRGH